MMWFMFGAFFIGGCVGVFAAALAAAAGRTDDYDEAWQHGYQAAISWLAQEVERPSE